MKKRLKSLSLATLTLLAVASCKNSDVDPREQYTGSYNITTTQYSKGTNGASATEVYKFNLYVSKGKSSDELVFKDDDDTYTVTMKNNTFEIPAHTTSIFYNGSTYAVKTVGNGSFAGNSINLNTVTGLSIQGITVTITKAGNGPKF
ncbi:hypothetical protein [Fibrisoma limi]|uniref:hypothetical protein n=1 Tax=Fibrisoma limi TaxID=663275 RepID=UPI0005871855|nr:hypothetical protein [Fibrisoma limi]